MTITDLSGQFAVTLQADEPRGYSILRVLNFLPLNRPRVGGKFVFLPREFNKAGCARELATGLAGILLLFWGVLT